MTGSSTPVRVESRRHRPASLKSRQAGLTLLELMVSLGLGLVLLAGTGTIYLGSRQAYQMQEGSGRLQETGRYALEMVGRGLRQSGTGAPWMPDLENLPADCRPSDQTACVPINGVNGAGTLPDTLTVQFYANNDELFNGNLGARDCTDGFAIMGTLVTNTYAVDNNANLTCTGSASGATVLLLSDIQDFQVLYGVDTDNRVATDNSDPYPSANLYTATPTAQDWLHVVSARVCVLVRSASKGMNVAKNQRYFNCAGALGVATCQDVSPPCLAGTNAFTAAPAGDTYLRRTFVATFSLRNLVNLPPPALHVQWPPP